MHLVNRSKVNLPAGLARMAIATLCGGIFAGICYAVVTQSGSTGYADPLKIPADKVQGALRIDREPLLSVAVAGSRTLAVGLRGLAAYSDDGGQNWQQSVVPVQSDLVSVQLLDQHNAWATGHDGVILHSANGGISWTKQFDRDTSRETLQKYYLQKLNAGHTGVQRYIDQIKLNVEGNVSLPFLGAWFTDQNNGYAVGSFGMLVATRDGGKSWVPWLDQIDNPEFLNLNAIRGIAGEVYITGEKGMVYRLDQATQKFAALPTGYRGTLFDIIGNEHFLLAFGLRGAAYRSSDSGRSWQPVQTGMESSITAGAVLGHGKRVLLLTDDGQALQSLDEGQSFRPLALASHVPAYGAAETAQGALAIVGYAGIQVAALQSSSAVKQ